VNRFTLRSKLALVALVLLVLPWAGYRYVREMERFLLAAQEQALAATARAVATALHDRPQLLAYRPADESELRRQAERELQRLAGGAATEREPPPAGDQGVTEIAAILKGVERASSRIWVVSRDYRVLALAGSLRRAEPQAPGLLHRHSAGSSARLARSSRRRSPTRRSRQAAKSRPRCKGPPERAPAIRRTGAHWSSRRRTRSG